MQEATEPKTIDLRLNGIIQYERSGHKIRCIVQYITMNFTYALVITSDSRICAGEDIILTMTPPFRRSKIICTGRVMRRSESDGLFEHSRGYLAQIAIHYIGKMDRRKLDLVLAQKGESIKPEQTYQFGRPATLTTSVKTGLKFLRDSLAKPEEIMTWQTQQIEKEFRASLHNILVVDDEVHHLHAMERTLRGLYKVFPATSGQDALSIMEEKDISFIIADQRMPGMTGIEFLEKTLEKHPNTIRMILTAYTDEQVLVDAINRVHVHKYMNKPWAPEEMRATVKEAIESFEIPRQSGV